jgi:putative transposase
MPKRKRVSIAPTEDWTQLRLLVTGPEQETYELIRELAVICGVPSGPRFGRHPSRHTVQQILADGPIPELLTRRYPPYANILDPTERRLAIVRLHAEGWAVKSIANYLQTSRPTVYATLRRWIAEGVIGLDDKPHTRKRIALETDLKAMTEVRRLQENPELGEIRIHAALKQLGIDLSPRTCGRILALNRQLYGLRGPTKQPRIPKEMPFRATRRHQYWTVDLRYLDMHRLGGGMIDAISILDNYSRAVLASALSRTQDLGAFLLVLFAAIRAFGSPEALVSDSGSIFKAKEAVRIYAALGIQKEQIEKRQPWQSYIETTFNIQRRGPKGTPDWHFAKATTWKQLQDSHDRWMADYNDQVHWAHQKRADKRRSPREVLSFVKGKEWLPDELQQIFRVARGERRVKPNGGVPFGPRFRHWDLYGERGLAQQRVAIWLSADVTTLTIEHAAEPLAQYTITPEPDHKQLKDVAALHLFENRFPSPQLAFWDEWELGVIDWRLALPRPARAPRRQRVLNNTTQHPLFPDDNIRTAIG